MSKQTTDREDQGGSRREFLASSALMATAVAGSQLAISRSAHAAGSDTIKLGLIGCGGRGSGAASDALAADPQTTLWAMADVFGDKIEVSINSLSKRYPDRIQVAPQRRFTGLDAYKGVIENSDVVLIACASRFHAPYCLATVQAGKHVFVEKPAAVDVAGVHTLMEADALAKQNGTGLLAGLTYRYHLGRREAIKRIHDGEIGEITAIQCDYLRSPYRLVGRNPAWSEMEYQFRNWYHFSWLSGDDVPQSLIHNLDSALWSVGDETPEQAYALGGRSTQFQEEMGTCFDHQSVIYEYPNGRRIYASSRTSIGCFGSNTDVFHGTKGRCIFAAFRAPKFTDLDGEVIWEADAEASKKSPYQQEHLEFLQSIRQGQPFQRGQQLAESTMISVLGQLAAYTGKRITWDKAFQSKWTAPPTGEVRMDTTPPVELGDDGLYPVAIPGLTELL